MKEKLLDYIRRNPRASFSEIERFFEKEGFDYSGENTIELRLGSNIMLWGGWNHTATGMLLDLIRSGAVVVGPADWVERICFGKMYDLPIANRLEHDYTELHWLPVVLSAAEVVA